MRIGYLEDTVQAHEITVTRVFTSCVHSSPGDPGPERQGWRGLAFLRGTRGSGLGFQELWTAGSLGLGALWAAGYPSPILVPLPMSAPSTPISSWLLSVHRNVGVHTPQEVVLVPLELHLALGLSSPGTCG